MSKGNRYETQAAQRYLAGEQGSPRAKTVVTCVLSARL
jgi:hypothetical protein